MPLRSWRSPSFLTLRNAPPAKPKPARKQPSSLRPLVSGEEREVARQCSKGISRTLSGYSLPSKVGKTPPRGESLITEGEEPMHRKASLALATLVLSAALALIAAAGSPSP